MEIKDIFTIPLLKHSIQNWSDIKSELIKSMIKLKFNENRFFSSSRNIQKNNFFTKKLSQILKNSFIEIEKEIKIPIKEIDSWVVQYKKYGEHIIHNHKSTGLAGVIYFDYNKELHTPTKYLIPHNDFFTDRTLIYEEPVEEGDLVIVPAMLHHFCSFNTSDQIRTIIGLDIKF